MPVTLKFERGRDDAPSHEIGPFEWVQITYDTIRIAPDGSFIASFGLKRHKEGCSCGYCTSRRRDGYKGPFSTRDWILEEPWEGPDDYYSDVIISAVP